MKLTNIILATIAAVGITTPAFANSISEHNRLLSAVNSTGISTKINPIECDAEPGVFGWYSAYNRELVICQENKIKGSSEQVEWTAEDFDTSDMKHIMSLKIVGIIHPMVSSIYKDPIN